VELRVSEEVLVVGEWEGGQKRRFLSLFSFYKNSRVEPAFQRWEKRWMEWRRSSPSGFSTGWWGAEGAAGSAAAGHAAGHVAAAAAGGSATDSLGSSPPVTASKQTRQQLFVPSWTWRRPSADGRAGAHSPGTAAWTPSPSGGSVLILFRGTQSPEGPAGGGRRRVLWRR